MSTYTQIIYQIVLSTRNRQRNLTENKREELFKYITGVIQNKRCHIYRIGGVEDHIHILTHVNPSIALADLVKDIKMASTDYIRRNKLFANFNGWQEGYGAFTYSVNEKDRLIEYIKNQKEHHERIEFRKEFVQMLTEHQITFAEKYLL